MSDGARPFLFTWPPNTQEGEAKIEYRVWNPFRSKLAAAILGGVDNVYIKPGAKVLYLGAASGTSVSHVSDIVGPVRAIWPSHFCFFGLDVLPSCLLVLLVLSPSNLLMLFRRRAPSTPSSSRRAPAAI